MSNIFIGYYVNNYVNAEVFSLPLANPCEKLSAILKVT